MSQITGRVGRALAIGLPSLFLIGVLLVPLRGAIPSAVVLMIVVLGSVGVVIAVERLRGRRDKQPKGTPLIGRRTMLVFGMGLGMYLVLATAIALRA